MEIKVRFCQATVKALPLARQQALRAGDLRVIRRVSTLVDLRDQEVPEVAKSFGSGETTGYRWLAGFVRQGVAGRHY